MNSTGGHGLTAEQTADFYIRPSSRASLIFASRYHHTYLFTVQSIIAHGIVPDIFGLGIIIPLI